MTTGDPRRARDLALLDAIDRFEREALAIDVWRIVPSGRDPALGRPSISRWCDGSFDALHTSLEVDGAIAEIHALLSLQPVFPSKVAWLPKRLKVSTAQTLRIADAVALRRLGIDDADYTSRSYRRTQEIGEAAHFLGFDGLLAPSARWGCLNLVLFTDRITPHQIELVDEPAPPIDWDEWLSRKRKVGKP